MPYVKPHALQHMHGPLVLEAGAGGHSAIGDELRAGSRQLAGAGVEEIPLDQGVPAVREPPVLIIAVRVCGEALPERAIMSKPQGASGPSAMP